MSIQLICVVLKSIHIACKIVTPEQHWPTPCTLREGGASKCRQTDCFQLMDSEGQQYGAMEAFKNEKIANLHGTTLLGASN